MNIVHQNIQSLTGKDLEIELFVEKFNVHILCITEHWLTSSQLAVNINNFLLSSVFFRTTAIHGGSLIFVRNNLKCKNRKDIVGLSVERIVELSCVELEQFVVVCVYRPPTGDYDYFEEIMEEVMRRLSTSAKKILICGDFNVDILKVNSMSLRFLNLFKCFDLGHAFNEPTRITATSASCLDNMFFNCDIVDKMIINKLSSDHCGQLITIPANKSKSNQWLMIRTIN